MRRSARLAATTDLVAKCHHAFVDPVLGATRHPTGSVEPASQPTHPAVSHLPAQRIRDGFRRPSRYGKAVPSDRVGQLRDARRSVAQQMHRQDIPKLDPSQLHRVVHRRTVARWSDIEPAVAERRPHRNNGLGDDMCDRNDVSVLSDPFVVRSPTPHPTCRCKAGISTPLTTLVTDVTDGAPVA